MIIVCPDSFKGSLTSAEAAEAIARGIRRAQPVAEIRAVPLADGGEGTVEALVTAAGGRIVSTPATGPLGDRIDSFIGALGDGQTALVEMAAASGLTLVPEPLHNPMLTTSYGTGELIKAALDLGCRGIILGLGGSATNDGGVGMIQALGGSFRDGKGQEIGPGGGQLIRINSIDVSALDPRLKKVHVTVASDVENPLTGPNGASAVFGPQKGATAEMVAALDKGLGNLANLIRRDLGVDIETTPGSGAAGGIGAAALAFLGAELRPGIDIVLEAAHFDEKLQSAKLVITGEGRADSQTLQGKTVSGVLKAAEKHRVPVIVMAGAIEPEGYALLDRGAAALLCIVDRPMSSEEAMTRAGELLERTAEQAARLHPL